MEAERREIRALTDAELDEIEARHAATAPLPTDTGFGAGSYGRLDDERERQEDARRASLPDVPRLLLEVRRLRGRRALGAKP